MVEDKDYEKAKKLTSIVEAEASEKIRSGHEIPDVISAYAYTTSKLLATMILARKVLGDSDYDADKFINESTELIKNTIKQHVNKNIDIMDKVNGILNN